MDFNRAQQALEALQAQCPHTDSRAIDVWIGAITRAREALLELQITNRGNSSAVTAAVTAKPGSHPGSHGNRQIEQIAVNTARR
jgi:hypothetical protein